MISEGWRIRRESVAAKSAFRQRRFHSPGNPLVVGFVGDLRYSLRRLLAAPAFSAAAILILALGIGGNSAMFSVLRDAILADPPYPDPEQLVLPAISHVYPAYTYHGASYPEFEMMRDLPDRMVDPIAGYTLVPVTLSGSGDAERVDAEVVTPEYFSLLGTAAALGRTFNSLEGDKNTPSLVAVIDDGFWNSRFGRDPNVLGREVIINGTAVTIVGVLPRGFRGVTGRGRIWLPMASAGVLMDRWRVGNHGSHWFSLLGKLRPGVSYEAAAAQFLSVAREIRRRWPDHGSNGDLVPTVRPFRTVARNETAQSSLLLLSAAAALVLLIICANLAGLLLARASSRTRETAIRLGIGAGRWRVMRQCLAECLLVGLAGGLVGLAVALWGIETFATLAPSAWISGSNDLQFVNLEMSGIDWGVTLFALGLSIGTSVLFGMLPALRLSSPKQMENLRVPIGTKLSNIRRAVVMRSLLVSSQVALALILLVGAGLMLKSLSELHGVETGCPPLGGLCATSQVRGIDGRPEIAESEWLQVGTLIVEDSYFEAVGARIIEGRAFAPTDWREASQVLILNETAAAELFPNERALGQRLSLGHSVMPEGSSAEVVGIASDILYSSPDVGSSPVVYLSSRQVPVENPTFIVRTVTEPFSVLPAIRAEMGSLDPGVPIHRAATVEGLGDREMGNTRLVMSVLSVFAAFATTLAVVGIYAIIAYSVSRRRREIGIRVAIGAPATGVIGLMLRQGVGAAAIGVIFGLGAAWASTRLFSSLLFGVSAVDPVSFASAALLLLAATSLASYIPARRVTRIDPIEVLRTE